MNKYKELLEKTIVPSTLSQEEQKNVYADITEYINKCMPKKLYRFRGCNERSFGALFRDELWFTSGSEMNDDYEARIYYDKDKIHQWIHSLINGQGNLKVLEQLRMMQNMPSGMENIIPNAPHVFELIKNLPENVVQQTSKQFLQHLNHNLEKGLERITNIIQSSVKFACFSRNIKSDMMWGHYAANSTGFALEFKFEGNQSFVGSVDMFGQVKSSCSLFPILYGSERFDATEFAVYLFKVDMLMNALAMQNIPYNMQWINLIVPCPDLFAASKLALNKSNEWKPEKEWRLFLTNLNNEGNNKKYDCILLKPSAIYLGRKISELNEKIIKDLVKDKEIPIFKMYIDDQSNNYKLKYYRIKS